MSLYIVGKIFLLVEHRLSQSKSTAILCKRDEVAGLEKKNSWWAAVKWITALGMGRMNRRVDLMYKRS